MCSHSINFWTGDALLKAQEYSVCGLINVNVDDSWGNAGDYIGGLYNYAPGVPDPERETNISAFTKLL